MQRMYDTNRAIEHIGGNTMPKSEYLDTTVADLAIERKVRQYRNKLDKAMQMIVNRQVTIHGLRHLLNSDGSVKAGAVEDWRECRWASCRNTRLVLVELGSDDD